MTQNSCNQADSQQKRIQSFAFVIATCAAVLLGVCFSRHYLAKTDKSCGFHLDNRINPNSAPVISLTRLQGIGPSRAGEIIAYRQNFQLKNDKPAFQKPDDLQNIKGIGPKTVEKMEKWLKFE